MRMHVDTLVIFQLHCEWDFIGHIDIWFDIDCARDIVSIKHLMAIPMHNCSLPEG